MTTATAFPTAAPEAATFTPDHADHAGRMDHYARLAAGFSFHVLGRPLRPYQKLVAAAVLESVLKGLGITFTVMMARQMGKNELSAHLEAGLLARHAKPGAALVKAAPTFRPQVTTSLQRLESLLKAAAQLAPLTRRRPDGTTEVLKPKKEHGYQLVLGDGRISFLSADPAASVVGATASLLLEIDEAQDVDPEKFTRDFRPMASAHNATTVLYGTAWTQDTLLEEQKRVNLELEQRDGIRRHFEFDWRHGAAVNPPYGSFVQGEIERLSIGHPLIRTQYLLLPLSEAGSFFTPEQRALLRGEHPRHTIPSPADQRPEDTYYVAGIDIAGPAEDPQDADHLLRSQHPRKDSTVVLIAEVTRMQDGPAAGAPITRIIQAYWWTGRPLHEQCDRLIALLKDTWKCTRVVVDASGLGLDLATRLQKALGEKVVEPFVFNAPAKSELAYALLAHATTGRLQMWAEDPAFSGPPGSFGSPGSLGAPAAKTPRARSKVPGVLGSTAQGYAALSPEANEFWREVERARTVIRGGQKLSFYVPEHYGHDDFLVALALLSRAARAAATVTPFVPSVWISPPPKPDYDSWDPEYWERERRYGLYGIPTDAPLTLYPANPPRMAARPPLSPANDRPVWPENLALPGATGNPDRSDRWGADDLDQTSTTPAMPAMHTLHSVSAPPTESAAFHDQADALYARLRRSVGLDD